MFKILNFKLTGDTEIKIYIYETNLLLLLYMYIKINLEIFRLLNEYEISSV